MIAWLSYMGWLIGVAALGYAIYFISRRVRDAGEGPPRSGASRRLPPGGRAPWGGPAALTSASERGSMSEREAALVAQARADALGTRAAVPPARDVATQAPHNTVELAAPGAIMKSAGDPLVRKAFAHAMKEVETKTYERGLWAMALVECNGDEKMARLAYMKARAADLVRADTRAAEATQATTQRPPAAS